MDSLTQLSLGAAVGEACIGRRAGHKAWLWGGFLGTLPDLDIVTYAFMDIVSFTEFHRGPSHSLTFFIPLSILLAYLFPKIHPKVPASRLRWGLFAFSVLFTHALLDCFTTWGTQLLWPFYGAIAWETIFVIDPLYTLPLLVPLILAIIYHKKEKRRRKLIRSGLVLSSAYLALTVLNKGYMDLSFWNSLEQKALNTKKLQIESYRSSPTPLNNLLWSCIARTSQGNYLVGYHSLLAPSIPIEFRKIPGRHELLKELRSYENVQGLIDISQGFYSIEKSKKGNFNFYDLRFGELFFWEPERAKPVFKYVIHPRENKAPRIERKEGASGLKEGDLSAFMRSIGKGVPMGKSESP